MGRGVDLERQQYWRDVLEEHRRSGESVAGFCRERDISSASFYNWRRKLAEEGAERFMAVELPPMAAMACCEVVVPNGCRVIVPPGHDADSLRSILTVLCPEESPC